MKWPDCECKAELRRKAELRAIGRWRDWHGGYCAGILLVPFSFLRLAAVKNEKYPNASKMKIKKSPYATNFSFSFPL